MPTLPTFSQVDEQQDPRRNDILTVSRRVDGVLCGVCPVVTPGDFGAVGDGLVDDTTALQDAIDFAIQQRLVLNLCSRTYRFDGSLAITDNVTIVNGELLSGGAVDIAILAHKPSDEYLTITLRDITVRNLQFPDKVGFNLVLGLRCTFDRCTFLKFWNGEQSRGMRIEGCVGCTFISCDWHHNNTLIEIKGRLRTSDNVLIPTTDTKTWSSRLQNARKANIWLSGNAHNNAWHGCWIENCPSGPLVHIQNGDYNSFYDCRMENNAGDGDAPDDTAAPTIIITADTTRSRGICWFTRVIGCTFSNTRLREPNDPSKGRFPVIMLTGDSFNTSFPTTLVGNLFPISSPSIEGSYLYTATANSVLADRVL